MGIGCCKVWCVGRRWVVVVWDGYRLWVGFSLVVVVDRFYVVGFYVFEVDGDFVVVKVGFNVDWGVCGVFEL